MPSAVVECWVKGRASESIKEGKAEHSQAQDRKDDPGDDELCSRAWALSAAFIAVRCGHSTVGGDAYSPHIAREFHHPTQFLEDGELARRRSGFGRGTCSWELVGKIWADERHVSGCEEEYSVAASKNVVLPGAL
jgi:hypothetical protein